MMKVGHAKMKCGLIGEKLSHSFSPQIHAELSDYSYGLFELKEDEVGTFVKSGLLDAYNVTIPYKKTVMPYLDVISPEASAIGAVNTVVRGKDGKLYGYNTDYFGFCHMLDVSKINVREKKAMVFGTGGASATVCAVLRDMGVSDLRIISVEDNTEDNLKRFLDTQIIVNATPVGMYPHNGRSPVDIELFKECEGVLDVIYNPAKTKLLLDAERLGIPHVNGLPMLVAQAARAFELFTGESAEEGICQRITSAIERDTKNIILVGMPGCGKTTVGKLIAKATSRAFYDADDVFEKDFGVSPADVISSEGEEKFRQMEHSVAEKLGKMSGVVISCGGGVVTREYNYEPLHQNGTIVFLERELKNLSKRGRPLSLATSPEEMYKARVNSYQRFADITVRSTEIPKNTAELILSSLGVSQKGKL